MEYVKFMDISLSRLGMGAMRLPQVGEGFTAPIDTARAEEIIDYCMANGVNYYDTAYIYHMGKSEVLLGEALSKYPRESFYVADKYNLHAKADYKAQFAEQLERLQMDYIDFYLLHGIDDNLASGYLDNGCIEYFLELKKAGKIKYLGFSFHGMPETLKQILPRHDWDFVQIQLNYYDWNHGTAKEQYDILKENNIPIMVMEPVHGGMLASLTDDGNAMLKAAEPNKSIASWAIRFVVGLDVAVILSGMSNMEQVIDNVQTFQENKRLSDADNALIEEACELLYRNIAATCTSCRYCVNDCPVGLDIPSLLNVYNDYKTGGPWRLGRLEGFPEDKRPDACISCGACVEQCPQNLDVPRFMTEMTERSAR